MVINSRQRLSESLLASFWIFLENTELCLVVLIELALHLFTSVGTKRGQGIVRVVVAPPGLKHLQEVAFE